MPKRSYRKCSVIDCPEVTNETYCAKHSKDKQRRKDSDKLYKLNRTDEREQKFYNSSEWKKVRTYKSIMDPLCEHCFKEDKLTPMDVIDHIIPIKVDWEKRLSLFNLQSLCQGCHNLKSAEDRRKYKELM